MGEQNSTVMRDTDFGVTQLPRTNKFDVSVKLDMQQGCSNY